MTDTRVNVHVAELLRKQVGEGRQIGVQVCAYHHGKVVVDTVAGTMGPDDQRPVQPDSLFLSFSSTKGVGALAIHMLADRGLIDYQAPVAEYWPGFAGPISQPVVDRSATRSAPVSARLQRRSSSRRVDRPRETR